MSVNLFYILLLVTFDSFSAVPPTNSEFWMMRYIYKNAYGNWYTSFIYYFSLYLISSILGGLIGYFIGYFLQDTIVNFLNFIFDLIFGNKIFGQSLFSNLLNSYDPVKILFFKSFTPGIPVSLFNVACGIKESHLIKFVTVTCIFRTLRFILMFIFKHYLQYSFITNIFYSTTIIYAFVALILLIYSTYCICINNIFFIFSY